jgi:hypothetical protein
MMHFEVAAGALQKWVPFELGLWEGDRAFVSVVAFVMRGMRLRLGGRAGAWLWRPLASHAFLNVRAYVRHGEESGIHLLAECLPNRLSVLLGPPLFALPYRLGRLSYEHRHEIGALAGCVTDARSGNAFCYRGLVGKGSRFEPCVAGSRNEWLMERYTAFNSAGRRSRFFRVWHEPWPQVEVAVTLEVGGVLASDRDVAFPL